ncbi:MAG: type II secretion system minor pseudopilin GspK [Kangiellaceae bacterium]
MMNYRQKQFKRRQKGTVLVTVILVVAFVALLIVEINKRVNYQSTLARNLIHRDQAYSYLIGMEELAKIYLQKAFKNETEDRVHLNQAWAQSDITFPIDGGGMTASIRDMQSCFNLNTLGDKDKNNNNQPASANQSLVGPQPVKPTSTNTQNTASGNINNNDKTIGEEIFTDYLDSILVDPQTKPAALAAELRDWIDEDSTPSGPDGVEDLYYQGLDIPYLPANDEIAHESELLAVRSFNKEIMTLIEEDICVLPDGKDNQLNVNTIENESANLLHAALGKKFDLAKVKEVISSRPEKGYDMQEFWDALGGNANVSSDLKSRLTDTSRYFQMKSKAQINTTKVFMTTLFIKEQNNQFKVVSRYFGKD